MYGKLFTSLYQGTLRGCADEILVFTNLIAHADIYGHVDKHWRSISEETGISVERVKAAIANLEAPDPESRSPEEEGRRIVPMDEHRAWGWRIVNYAKYRSIRNEDDRREQNRLAQQRWRDKHPVSKVSRVSPDKPKQKQKQKQKKEELSPNGERAPLAKSETHPIILALQDGLLRRPAKKLEAGIIELFDGIDTEIIRTGAKAWLLRGWNPTNYRGLADWCRNGFPEHVRSSTGGQNGQYKSAAEKNGERAVAIEDLIGNIKAGNCDAGVARLLGGDHVDNQQVPFLLSPATPDTRTPPTSSS